MVASSWIRSTDNKEGNFGHEREDVVESRRLFLRK